MATLQKIDPTEQLKRIREFKRIFNLLHAARQNWRAKKTGLPLTALRYAPTVEDIIDRLYYKGCNVNNFSTIHYQTCAVLNINYRIPSVRRYLGITKDKLLDKPNKQQYNKLAASNKG